MIASLLSFIAGAIVGILSVGLLNKAEKMKRKWIVMALLAGSILYYFFDSPTINTVGLLLGKTAMIIFLLSNLRLSPWGFSTATVGFLTNLLVLSVNGLKMPAMAAHGIARGIRHIPMNESTKLNFLGDWISIPDPYKIIVVSPGDILLLLGLFLAGLELLNLPRISLALYKSSSQTRMEP